MKDWKLFTSLTTIGTVLLYILGILFHSASMSYFNLDIHEFSLEFHEYLFYGFVAILHMITYNLLSFFLGITILGILLQIIYKVQKVDTRSLLYNKNRHIHRSLKIKLYLSRLFNKISSQKIRSFFNFILKVFHFIFDFLEKSTNSLIYFFVAIYLIIGIILLTRFPHKMGENLAKKHENNCILKEIDFGNGIYENGCKIICEGSYCAYTDGNITFIDDNGRIIKIK
ncbi:MAG: Unknown protein [uncultured Campylobacterales bacterium]|uniref:Uncharacterized protein n=1 Tax=uncultured Campylobacterales bacterium TaxID=352960 RepID=A0A6S6SW70_9BACT|nr:MAG: Unknown protein [uncultured Campylobacterales bacterium]